MVFIYTHKYNRLGIGLLLTPFIYPFDYIRSNAMRNRTQEEQELDLANLLFELDLLETDLSGDNLLMDSAQLRQELFQRHIAELFNISIDPNDDDETSNNNDVMQGLTGEVAERRGSRGSRDSQNIIKENDADDDGPDASDRPPTSTDSISKKDRLERMKRRHRQRGHHAALNPEAVTVIIMAPIYYYYVITLQRSI